MTNEISVPKTIGAVSEQWAARVDELTKVLRQHPAKVELPIEQHLHAGMYSRTVHQPAGVLCTAVMVHVPTQLIVHGHCRIYADGTAFEVNGHAVLEGVPGRQIVVYTLEDTWGTMCFGTQAKTIEEAEKEFAGDGFKELSNHWEK
nr:MAG TPA: hypothetical protein [Caudoviricetes sp.]